MKKRRSFLRVPVLLFLAAGVGVAILASREDGRKKLTEFGEMLATGAEVVGSMINNSRQALTEYMESQRGATPVNTYEPSQTNGAAYRQGEYSTLR